MRRGEIEGVKGRGQTAAEEATQRRTGEEKMSEWEISPTLEERPVLSSRMRGKDWREGKEGVGDGKGGEISAASQTVLGQLPFFFFFPGGGIITEFIWLQVSHWKTWVFISVQPDASITKRAGILFIIKNEPCVRLICLHRRSSWATRRHLAILQQRGRKQLEMKALRSCFWWTASGGQVEKTERTSF